MKYHQPHDPEKDTIAKLKQVKPTHKSKQKQSSALDNQLFKHLPEEEVILGWLSESKEEYHKGSLWYVGVCIILIAGIILGIITKSWTTSIVFILLAATLILQSNSNTELHEVFITEKGLYIDKKLYEYKHIKEFWIIENEFTKKLRFIPKGFEVEKTILIDDIDTMSIRAVLKNFIPENPHKKEHLIDHIIRFFKL